jgi:hypothetical protein
MRRRMGSGWACVVALLGLAMAGTLANATTFQREANLVDLLQQSELILRGTVSSVTDGIDERGVPYTEVTLTVSDAIKGEVGKQYTFRQFGLLKPRDMGNGRMNLMVTPAGWATYSKGEDTLLFLRKKAAWTGLQTTSGLIHGKFKVAMGNTINQANNAGLFKNVQINPALLSSNEQRAMLTTTGPVNANAFISLVRQAVKNQWVEKGSMRNVQK